MAKPEKAVNNGRDDAGKFLPGNKAGRGNPVHRRMNELRTALMDATTPDDVKAVGAKLKELALAGDVMAARVWLDHAIGRPPASIELTGADGEPLRVGFNDLALEV